MDIFFQKYEKVLLFFLVKILYNNKKYCDKITIRRKISAAAVSSRLPYMAMDYNDSTA